MYVNKSTQNAVIMINELKTSSEPVRVLDVATKHKLSFDYMSQIATKLKRAGIIQSQRGPNGGYFMKKKKVSLLDIAKAFPTPKLKLIAEDPWLVAKVSSALEQIVIV